MNAANRNSRISMEGNKQMDIAFDIETIRNSSRLDAMPEPEVKTGNLKDPAKIAEKVAEARAEQIEKMALNPLYGRICAFVAVTEEQTRRCCINNDSDEEETRIVEAVFHAISGKRVITYNGNSFDLPFVYRRAVLLGVDPREFGAPTLAEMAARYGNKYHVDLMNVWCGFGSFEKLDAIAGAILGDHKIEIDFREFPELIRTEDGRKKLLDYCEQDVLLTLKLWNRFAGILV